MKKLSKDQEKACDEHVKALGEAADKVRIAIGKLNAAIDEHVNSALSEYNEALANAETFRDELVGDMESYADGAQR